MFFFFEENLVSQKCYEGKDKVIPVPTVEVLLHSFLSALLQGPLRTNKKNLQVFFIVTCSFLTSGGGRVSSVNTMKIRDELPGRLGLISSRFLFSTTYRCVLRHTNY